MPSIEQIDVDKVLAGLKHATATAANEEELRIKASAILESEVISKLGITPGKYEYTFVSGGRSDALYGHVIIEYKAPGKLLKEPDVAKAKGQLIGYIKKEAEVEDRFKLFLGVILADRIAFVRYDEKTKNWLIRGPYDLNRETVLRFVEAIRGLRRKKLAVDELLRDFGPKSNAAVSMVNVFYGKVVSSRSPKVEALFNDWKRLFSQVCAYSPEKLKGLEAEYGLTGKVDYSALLFAVHTYYALVMKLLAAEVAYLFGAGKWLKSYVSELEDANMKGLEVFKRALEDLESGGVFRKFLNITNFIEGDYFSWYLEELDQETANKIADLAKRLADYEPATPVLEPEYTRDLLKRLYQNLLPKKIRHDLGEFYTPDWLADVLLDEIELNIENLNIIADQKGDLTKPLDLRVLDPACGSGTFLVLAIKRFRDYAEEHYLKDVLTNYMLKNIVGFDLNPLAVLTARTNYLLTMADLLTYAKGPIEIPIYLADSLLVETRTTLTGVSYAIRTYVGIFELPKSTVDKGMLGRLLEAVDRYVRLRYKPDEFRKVVEEEQKMDEQELRLVTSLYETFLKLEREGKNHVWTSIIRNAFAPLTTVSAHGKFDFVIGNPPWVNWESLPEEYRHSVTFLWEKYGLQARATSKQFELGKMGRDISYLFTHVCADKYLKDNCMLGFLITWAAFKSRAAEVFRKFTLPNGKPLQVVKVGDLVRLKPFEGASNLTSYILLKKGTPTAYPIPYILWIEENKQEELIAEPSHFKRETSPWIIATENALKAIEKARGESRYLAYKGVSTSANSVYWVKILESYGNQLLIENLHEEGKRKSQKIVAKVEAALVRPIIRGKDVRKWSSKISHYIILPHTEQTKWRAIEEKKMKTSFPLTYEYFYTFRDTLLKRALYTKLRMGHPFYIVTNIHGHSFSTYKVAWKRMGNVFSAAVINPISDKSLRKVVPLLHEDLVFIPSEDENEAHYICSLLNSAIFNFLILSATEVGGKGLAPPSIINHIKIGEYDPTDNLHKKLSTLSKRAHQFVFERNAQKLSKVEMEIENTVAQLYDLTENELKELKKSLAILKGEEFEEEISKKNSERLTKAHHTKRQHKQKRTQSHHGHRHRI